MDNAEYMKKWYYARIAKGLCPRCGAAALEGITTCLKHTPSRVPEDPVGLLMGELEQEDTLEGW
jgi:hypothetical protein